MEIINNIIESFYVWIKYGSILHVAWKFSELLWLIILDSFLILGLYRIMQITGQWIKQNKR